MQRSLQSFTFFIKEHSVLCVLYKIMRRSLRSFTCFIKERKRTLRSFWFHKSYKNDKSRKKHVKEWCILFKRTQFSAFFFAKERCVLCVLLRSLQKNIAFFAFFYVLCKIMLHSFTFLRKECIVLLGFISCQKLENRTQKNVVYLKRTKKNDAFRT